MTMTSEAPVPQEDVRATPVGSPHGATWRGEFWIEHQAWQAVTNGAGEPIAYASEEAALAGARLRLYEARREPPVSAAPASATPPQPAAAPQKRAKRERPKSRPTRWADAAGEAASALSEIEEALGRFTSAMEELRSVQEEYEEWKDNLDGKFEGSAVADKLETVTDLSIEGAAEAIQTAIDEARTVVDEAEGAELPLGFGRD